VYNIIEIYTAYVSDYNREKRYNEFLKVDSMIRIIFATTALGIGINIPNILRVCLWTFPIGRNLGDFWQRIGRRDRGLGRTSSTYIFLPY
jgi:superfamily II DNA helicase RecQ